MATSAKKRGSTARLTIEEMQAIATLRGGQCLSKRYVNSATPLKWECAKGHRWNAMPYNVKNGTWCGVCVKERTYLTLDDIKRAAVERGGRCLSETYVNSYTHLLFECAEGHRWQARPGFVLHRSWCPHCARVARRRTIEQMRTFAQELGGQCLSERYVPPPALLRWRCAQGHEWQAPANKVYNRHNWCGQCNVANQRLGIEKMRELAAAQGGVCLSSTYVNNRTPLEWQCAKGHRWEVSGQAIIIGGWCPSCRKCQMLADLQMLACGREGECLAAAYVDSHTKLRWRCSEGHIWKSTPSLIKQGAWCPQCALAARKGYSVADMQALAHERGGQCLSDDYAGSHVKLRWQCDEGMFGTRPPPIFAMAHGVPTAPFLLGPRIQSSASGTISKDEESR